MFKHSILFITILFLVSCQHKTKNNFFNTLSQYCGQSIEGKTVFPDDPNHAFANKKLLMHLAKCTDKEIRIPFRVGKDTSRTWIISKTSKGLLLKHDHRHADGTADDITMYGGYEDSQSTALSVNFVADDATAKMLPEAKTNVWTLSFDKKQKQFIYSLKRHDKPRYEATFDILP